MPAELTVLALAALLQMVQVMLASMAVTKQTGIEANIGPRDDVPKPTGIAGRLKRAADNHFEGLVLFTIAVVVVTVGGQSSGLTVACAWLYLAARILYVPAYAYGWAPWRSVIWMVGAAATLVMILASLF